MKIWKVIYTSKNRSDQDSCKKDVIIKAKSFDDMYNIFKARYEDCSYWTYKAVSIEFVGELSSL